jgi:hypothetical protein
MISKLNACLWGRGGVWWAVELMIQLQDFDSCLGGVLTHNPIAGFGEEDFDAHLRWF